MKRTARAVGQQSAPKEAAGVTVGELIEKLERYPRGIRVVDHAEFDCTENGGEPIGEIRILETMSLHLPPQLRRERHSSDPDMSKESIRLAALDAKYEALFAPLTPQNAVEQYRHHDDYWVERSVISGFPRTRDETKFRFVVNSYAPHLPHESLSTINLAQLKDRQTLVELEVSGLSVGFYFLGHYIEKFLDRRSNSIAGFLTGGLRFHAIGWCENRIVEVQATY